MTHSPRLATLAAWFFFAWVAGLSPVAAQRSAWVETQGGDLRLVVARPQADGAWPAILEIRLAPGWRTYWTDPGASGIPPEVTVAAKGPGAEAITYSGLRLPPPRHFVEGDLHYVGYDRPVAFPLLLTARPAPGGGPPDLAPGLRLEASVFLGICKSICIPVQARIALDLAPTADDNRLDAARIRAAFAALPQAPAPDFAVTQTRFDAARGEIVLTLTLPEGSETPDVFLAAPSGYALTPPRLSQGPDGLSRATIGMRPPPKRAGPPPDGSMRATIRAGGRAIETPLVFGP